jgi:hypothetical protein
LPRKASSFGYDSASSKRILSLPRKETHLVFLPILIPGGNGCDIY